MSNAFVVLDLVGFVKSYTVVNSYEAGNLIGFRPKGNRTVVIQTKPDYKGKVDLLLTRKKKHIKCTHYVIVRTDPRGVFVESKISNLILSKKDSPIKLLEETGSRVDTYIKKYLLTYYSNVIFNNNEDMWNGLIEMNRSIKKLETSYGNLRECTCLLALGLLVTFLIALSVYVAMADLKNQ